MTRILCILCLCLALGACRQPTPSYAGFADVPPEGWPYADTLYIEPVLPDSVAVGRLAVAVRHTDGYEYRNLWLEIATPMLDSITADTANVSLADDYGRWYGRGTGVSYMTVDTLPGSYYLTRGRPAQVRHVMRVDTLPGIEQIGIIFIPD